jgi:hypothetical protein
MIRLCLPHIFLSLADMPYIVVDLGAFYEFCFLDNLNVLNVQILFLLGRNNILGTLAFVFALDQFFFDVTAEIGYFLFAFLGTAHLGLIF